MKLWGMIATIGASCWIIACAVMLFLGQAAGYFVVLPIGVLIWGIRQWAKKEIEPRVTISFIRENCIGCRFAYGLKIGQGEYRCSRPEPPEFDRRRRYCLSGEVTTDKLEKDAAEWYRAMRIKRGG